MRVTDYFLILFIAVLIMASYLQIDWKEEFNMINLKPLPSHTPTDMVIGYDGRLITNTVLNKADYKIQEETGCIQNCHKDFR